MARNLDGSIKKVEGQGAGGGRPYGLNLDWILVATEVLQDDENILARTDEDIVNEVNYILEYSDRADKKISLRTYYNYKKLLREDNTDKLNDLPYGLLLTLSKFLQLLDKKIRTVKKTIVKNLQASPMWWTRYAWLMERKFTKAWALTSKLAQMEIEIKSTTKEDLEDKEDTLTEVEITIVTNRVGDEAST